MYEEYINAYKHHSSTYGADTAVFYQVGKFYEFYDWVAADTGETQTSMRRFTDILGVRVRFARATGLRRPTDSSPAFQSRVSTNTRPFSLVRIGQSSSMNR